MTTLTGMFIMMLFLESVQISREELLAEPFLYQPKPNCTYIINQIPSTVLFPCLVTPLSKDIKKLEWSYKVYIK